MLLILRFAVFDVVIVVQVEAGFLFKLLLLRFVVFDLSLLLLKLLLLRFVVFDVVIVVVEIEVVLLLKLFFEI